MTSATQYTISLKEVAEFIIRKENITEGRWTVGVGFGLSVGHHNLPPKNEARPAISVAIENLVLSRAPDGDIPDEMLALTVDAAELQK